MEFKTVGQSVWRIDREKKVRGEALYTIDLKMAGMLHGRILRSPLPHAKIESIGSDGKKLHPLRKALLDHQAFQCGYCTPGMILMAKALLDRNANPSKEEIRAFMAGNIYRCTSYVEIVRAVKQTARRKKRRP